MTPVLLLLLACGLRPDAPDALPEASAGGPARVEPALPAVGPAPAVLGWSRSGDTLAVCVDAPLRRCVFVTADASATTAATGALPLGATPLPDGALEGAAAEARLAAEPPVDTPGRWPYADTVVLAWQVTPGAPGGADAVAAIGARVQPDGRAAYRVSLSAPGHDAVRVEHLALSPDARFVGVVVRAARSGDPAGDELRVAVVPARSLLYAAFSAGRAPAP